MAIDRRAAALELNSKLRLEARLRPPLKKVERDLARQVIRNLGTTGVLPDVRSIQASELEPILLEHYELVGTSFTGNVANKLPTDVAETDEEKMIAAAAMAQFFAARAPEQARVIAETSELDARRAVSIADQERRHLIDEGEPLLSQFEVAAIAGAVFFRSLVRRTTGIVMSETQAAAEATKLTEAETLLDKLPSILGGDKAPVEVVKEWVTQGDSRVRTPPKNAFDHLAADSTQVPVNEPFMVSGERLMYPGDTSLGASPGNVVNCRCSAAHDVEAIASARQR